MNNKGFISKNTLKLIAFVCMVIDHVGYIFFPQQLILRMIGRISFPIFSFCIADGYIHTHSKEKYLRRMCIFAFINIIPFSLCFFDTLFSPKLTNTIFELFGGILAIYLHENNVAKHNVLFFSTFFICLVSEILKFDYGALGILLILGFYISLKSKNPKRNVLITGITYSIVSCLYFSNWGLVCLFSALALLPILSYNPDKFDTNKKNFISKSFYLLYTGHLLILFLIKFLLKV